MIENLNKLFESRIRLGIMSVLAVNDWVDFNSLKEYLNTSDGNLSSHLTALEKAEYIKVRKEFVSRRPKSSYCITPAGKTAFNEHLKALEILINLRK